MKAAASGSEMARASYESVHVIQVSVLPSNAAGGGWGGGGGGQRSTTVTRGIASKLKLQSQNTAQKACQDGATPGMFTEKHARTTSG